MGQWYQVIKETQCSKGSHSIYSFEMVHGSMYLHNRTLYELYGCGIILVRSVWDSLTWILIHKKRKGKSEVTVEEQDQGKVVYYKGDIERLINTLRATAPEESRAYPHDAVGQFKPYIFNLRILLLYYTILRRIILLYTTSDWHRL